MKTKFLVSSKFLSLLTLMITLTLTCTARAEYYQVYDGCMECSTGVVYEKVVRQYPTRHYSCHHKVHHQIKHHSRHHKRYKRTHYNISVYYYVPYVPCCTTCCTSCTTCCSYPRTSCGGCQRVMHPCRPAHWSRSYVEFSGMPTSYRDAVYYTNDETESSRYLDRGTMDDDSNYYPDMNIN